MGGGYGLGIIKNYFKYMFATNLICGIELLVYFAMFDERYNNYDFWSMTKSLLGLIPYSLNDSATLGTNNPLWYICVLVICAFMFDITIKYLLGVKSVLVFYIIFLVFAMQCLSLKLELPFLNNNFCRGYIGFSMGVIAYLSYILNKERITRFSILYLILLLFHFKYDLLKYNNFYYILCVCFFCIVIIATCLNKFVKNINIPFEFINGISLHLYFWHTPFLFLLIIINRIFGFEYDLSTLFRFLIGLILWAIGFQVITIRIKSIN